jgi:RHS repeat-associated protein
MPSGKIAQSSVAATPRAGSGTFTVGERVYALQDANFNVTALVVTWDSGSTWTVAERFVYDAYGIVTAYGGDWTPQDGEWFDWSYLHQGLRLDRALGSNSGGELIDGWYDNRHRVYSPTLMRFAQQDSSGYVDGGNLYGYLAGRAINGLDPQGLELCFEGYVTFEIKVDWREKFGAFGRSITPGRYSTVHTLYFSPTGPGKPIFSWRTLPVSWTDGPKSYTAEDRKGGFGVGGRSTIHRLLTISLQAYGAVKIVSDQCDSDEYEGGVKLFYDVHSFKLNLQDPKITEFPNAITLTTSPLRGMFFPNLDSGETSGRGSERKVGTEFGGAFFDTAAGYLATYSYEAAFTAKDYA